MHMWKVLESIRDGYLLNSSLMMLLCAGQSGWEHLHLCVRAGGRDGGRWSVPRLPGHQRAHPRRGRGGPVEDPGPL